METLDALDILLWCCWSSSPKWCWGRQEYEDLLESEDEEDSKLDTLQLNPSLLLLLLILLLLLPHYHRSSSSCPAPPPWPGSVSTCCLHSLLPFSSFTHRKKISVIFVAPPSIISERAPPLKNKNSPLPSWLRAKLELTAKKEGRRRRLIFPGVELSRRKKEDGRERAHGRIGVVVVVVSCVYLVVVVVVATVVVPFYAT